MKRLLLCVSLLAAVSCAETFNAAAATVNGEEISRAAVDEQVEASLQGGGATDPSARAQVARDVLSNLIRQRLLAQQAQRRGLDATGEEIQEQLDQIRAGYPDDASFEQAVANAGLTMESLNERIALQILSTELAAELAPEPSAAEIQEAYDAQRDSFREVQLKHILFAIEGDDVAAARTKAEDALDAVRARPASFAELARSSDDPSSADHGGVLANAQGNRPGWLADGDIDAGLFDAAFQARPGVPSGPVRTALGFHVFVTIAKRTAPLERVRDRIVEDLKLRSGDAAMQQAIAAVASTARILINPRYGDWDPISLTIVPHTSYVPAEPSPSPSASFGFEPGVEIGG